MKIIEIYIKINRLKKGDSVKNQNPLFSFYKEKRGNSPFTGYPNSLGVTILGVNFRGQL